MASQPTASTTSASSLQLTAQNVLDMFKDLGIPVCDDEDLIKQKFDARRDYYLRCLKNPQPSIHEKGEIGIKNGELLLKRRPELLRIVYEHFVSLADTAISVALSSGISSLTTEVIDNLRTLLVNACKVDQALAERFLADYMQERKLEPEKELVTPGLIPDLTARSGADRISLQWQLPAEHWDEVEIVREQDTPAPGQTQKAFLKNSSARRKVVFKEDGGTSFVDQDVTPGVRYTYRAHSIFQNVAGPDAVARAVCIGEVRAARAVWQTGRVQLSWELPGPNVSIIIFRRANGVPEVRFGAGEPQAVASHTTQVYRSSGENWADPDVTEGLNYHYLIIADFGAGLFSKGVGVQATVPKAPSTVPSLTALYKSDAGQAVVTLEWQPAQGTSALDYVVVRREGSAAPARVDDGVVVQTTAQTSCLDGQVSAGKRYSYAVFARAGELYSRTGTAAPPVDIMAEVSDLKAETDEGTVELQWTTPANTKSIIVRRSLNPPDNHLDGALVSLVGSDHAKDENLQNGRRYHYLVCCAYRPDGRTEVISAGVRISAVPDRLPQPIADFSVRAETSDVVCTWTPPAHGMVVVVRSAEPQRLTPGQRLSANDVNGLGQRIVTSETGSAVDTQPDANEPHYTVFTLAGSHAIAGGCGSVVVCPDVSGLMLSATRSGVILRWIWPPGCMAVRVVRRVDTWPTGPQDPESASIPVMRTEYAAAGEKFVDRLEKGRGRYHYVVYAQATGAPGLFFAPGKSTSCRGLIQWESWMTLRYQLLAGKARGASIRLAWSVDQPFPDFHGFVLVASQSGEPASPEEGVELFRWTPDSGSIHGAHEESVSIAPVQQRRWARFFCSLFALDPAQRHTTLIIHPNACLPISESGAFETGKSESVARIYRRGVPRTVICPRCFDEFPVAQMLYTSFGNDGDAQTGHYNWLNRVLRRPPQAPSNKQGQRLTRKIGPSCKHDLPFTAGAQESLIIGLIGAKYSGKSHYVAALVRRLQEQVCNDLQAALIPMSDETQDRYQREFYEPLFGSGLELPVTVGAPPPLIYDLTLSGSLWNEERNRAVTLTLYDTAGENLDRTDTVRQMVEYLRPASGIIFLIDPLQVPAVREALPSQVRLPQLDVGADPNAMIGRVLQVLKEGGVMKGDTLSTPIAVALTKCDVLRDAGLIAENRLWSTDARHIGYFDDEASQDMTGMMGSYVQRWSQAAYNTVVRHFSRHAFFGVSATGCAPDKNTHRYKFISPWRVEDPLLWLLAEVGVIPRRSRRENPS